MARWPARKTDAAWVSIRFALFLPKAAESARDSKTSCWLSASWLICRNSSRRRQPLRPKRRGQNAGLTAHLAAIKAYNAERRESGGALVRVEHDLDRKPVSTFRDHAQSRRCRCAGRI